jgi:NADH-quinone oxidoreductase subunit D
MERPASDLFNLYNPDEEMVLNMGPQHPSTHGVLNFKLYTDGEVIRKAVPEVGYLHRSLEKIAEKVGYYGFMPYTDRIDYVAAMTANQCWAMAVERLAGIEVPKRAEYLRTIVAELNRISSHLIAVGSMAMDIGAITPFPYALRERETVNDLLEELCGARLTYNYVWIGGVAFDLPEGWEERCLKFLDHIEPTLDEFDNLISKNHIYIERLANIAVVPAEMAIGYGLVGPNLRASGVDWDLRRDVPYSVYPELEFKVAVGQGWYGTVGDCWDRYYVRVVEMRESAKLVRQCLRQLPDGPYMAKVPKTLKPAGKEAHARVEAARGEMTCYVVSDGTPNPYRARFRTGSFNVMGIIEPLSRGLMIADLVALIASIDVVAPEIDR